MKKLTLCCAFLLLFAVCSDAQAAQETFYTLMDNGDKVTITSERVCLYDKDSDDIKWTYNFCSSEGFIRHHSTQPDNKLKILISSSQEDTLYILDCTERKATSSILAERVRGPVFALKNGIAYLNPAGEVVQWNDQKERSAILSIPLKGNIGGLFNAVSAESCTYLCLSFQTDGQYQKYIVCMSEGGEMIYAHLIPGPSTDVFPLSMAAIEDTLIFAYQSPFSAEGKTNLLWLSKKGEIITQFLVSDVQGSVTIKNDPFDPLVHVFLSNHKRIRHDIYDGLGNRLERTEYEMHYPFTLYYWVNGAWCIWSNDHETYSPLK